MKVMLGPLTLIQGTPTERRAKRPRIIGYRETS
jgi:hypothetical protein